MVRQTDLTFEELLKELKVPRDQKCFLLNEIGSILKNGEEKAKEVESFLRRLLDSEDLTERFYAFCYLSTTEGVDIKTRRKLKKFKKDPNNWWILERAEIAIRFRSQLH